MCFTDFWSGLATSNDRLLSAVQREIVAFPRMCVCVRLCLVGLLTSLVFGNEDFFTKTLD